MKPYIVVATVAAALLTSNAYSYSSYGSPYQITPSTPQSNAQVTWDWGINKEPNDGSPGFVTCGTTQCAVGFIPRTGLGPNASGTLCDMGGVCRITPSTINSMMMVLIPDGSSWDTAYETFISKYGMSGSGSNSSSSYNPGSQDYKDVAWGKLCIGFASLPYGSGNEHMAVSVLAPGTTCGVIPPPDHSCSVNLPSALDFGVISVGSSGALASASGEFSCTSESNIAIALGAMPKLDGVGVSLSINGVQLTQSSQIVGKGESGELSLQGILDGPMLNAGDFTTAVPLLISYF